MINEEKQFEKQYNYFENKREKFGLQTIWCIYEIRTLSLKSQFKGKWLTNGINNDIKVPLPNKQLTGSELWKAADTLYEMLGDTEHKFIESFEQKGDTIEVFFGS